MHKENINTHFTSFKCAADFLNSPILFKKYIEIINPESYTFDPELNLNEKHLPAAQNIYYNFKISNIPFINTVIVDEKWKIYETFFEGHITVCYGEFIIKLKLLDQTPIKIEIEVVRINKNIIPDWILRIILNNTKQNIKKILDGIV
ncbi:MAG: hypothetical protein CBD11_00935 [Phycisphaera sp. TMED151]|nr:MAG: hypothetical protein CBD11_00935 [Phycisphaera sp. TMED151]RPG10720.1 MAG: hypothetical protein CBB84_000040 [Phycisphaera sp. TMED24]